MNEDVTDLFCNAGLQYEQNMILNQKFIYQFFQKFYNDYLNSYECNLTFCEFVLLFVIVQDNDLQVALQSLIYQYSSSEKYDQTKFKQIIHHIQYNNSNDNSANYLKEKTDLPMTYKQLLLNQEKRIYDMNGKNQQYYYDINNIEFSVKPIINNSISFQQNICQQKPISIQKDYSDIVDKDNFLSQTGSQNNQSNQKKQTLNDIKKFYTDKHDLFDRASFTFKSQLNYISNYLQEIKSQKQDGPFKSQFLYNLFTAYSRLRTKHQNKDVHRSNQASVVFLITFIEEFKNKTEFDIVQLLTYQDEISIPDFVNNICFNQSQKIQNIQQFRSTAIYSTHIYDINMYIEFSNAFQLSDIMDSDWKILFDNYQHCNFIINANKSFVFFREVESGSIIVSHSAEEAFQKINYRLVYDVIIVSSEPLQGIQQMRIRTLHYSNTSEKPLRFQLRHTNELSRLYLSRVKCTNMNKFINLRLFGSINNEYTQVDLVGMRNLKVFCSKNDIYLQESKSLLEVIFQKAQLVCVSIQKGTNIAKDAVLHTGLKDLRVFYIDHQLNLVIDQTISEAEYYKVLFMYDETEDKFKIPTVISKRIKLKQEQDHQLISY